MNERSNDSLLPMIATAGSLSAAAIGAGLAYKSMTRNLVNKASNAVKSTASSSVSKSVSKSSSNSIPSSTSTKNINSSESSSIIPSNHRRVIEDLTSSFNTGKSAPIITSQVNETPIVRPTITDKTIDPDSPYDPLTEYNKDIREEFQHLLLINKNPDLLSQFDSSPSAVFRIGENYYRKSGYDEQKLNSGFIFDISGNDSIISVSKKSSKNAEGNIVDEIISTSTKLNDIPKIQFLTNYNNSQVSYFTDNTGKRFLMAHGNVNGKVLGLNNKILTPTELVEEMATIDPDFFGQDIFMISCNSATQLAGKTSMGTNVSPYFSTKRLIFPRLIRDNNNTQLIFKSNTDSHRRYSRFLKNNEIYRLENREIESLNRRNSNIPVLNLTPEHYKNAGLRVPSIIDNQNITQPIQPRVFQHSHINNSEPDPKPPNSSPSPEPEPEPPTPARVAIQTQPVDDLLLQMVRVRIT